MPHKSQTTLPPDGIPVCLPLLSTLQQAQGERSLAFRKKECGPGVLTPMDRSIRVVHFHCKCSIFGENPKNTITGRSPQLGGVRFSLLSLSVAIAVLLPTDLSRNEEGSGPVENRVRERELNVIRNLKKLRTLWKDRKNQGPESPDFWNSWSDPARSFKACHGLSSPARKQAMPLPGLRPEEMAPSGQLSNWPY